MWCVGLFNVNFIVRMLLFVDILTEEIILPALAGAGYEEPVVVESDIITSKLVLSITVGLLCPGPLEKVLVVVGGR